jgi:hypothetical protein
MNGLVILLGECFRTFYGVTGGNRIRGQPDSYDEQIKACNSHVHFMEHIKTKFALKNISTYISSYTTQFDNDLLQIYDKYLVGYDLYDNLIGINNLFQNTVKKIKNIEDYDFILCIRIDLFLKEHFMNVFNPNANMILFPSICWLKCYKICQHPRVNCMMLFIPKKYYKYLDKITDVEHNTWYDLINNTDLTYEDLDTILNTYHDSNSYNDYNPLYYIVNRPESTIFHSEGHFFNKYNF